MSLQAVFCRSTESSFGNLAVLAFLAVQALDGTMTYVGLSTVARVTEGNPLVAALVGMLGLGAGLASAKFMAASLGIVLHLCGTHRLIALLTAVYVVAALVPWMAVFATLA